ncbi:MAG TPA: beta-ketoacyl-[acyl-carrier-protein] synthase family protein, partial [Polyangiaceae bacterium]
VSVDRVARALGSVARSATVCSACSSGAVALALGASWLLSGHASRVVAGGVDGLCQLTFTGFNSLGAMDPEPCRPFDVARAGLNLGEGAACLVLELESVARARGARVIAYLSGWAVASEAHHVTHPEPSGERAARVMLDALAVAALEPRAIDYVNAHGTGTAQNDAMEARALARVFGSDVSRVWVSSSKAQVGHTLGAAGAIEAAVTALALERGVLLPNVGLENAEAPELRLVRGGKKKQALSHALSNSFGFGGACAVLAFDAASVPARAVAETRRNTIVISGSASAPAVSEPITLLNADRSRRFGRASALVVATAERALEHAALAASGTGLVVGSAFGDVERSVRFLQKLFAQGPKFASPAEFPQLVASTGSGNASIYLGLTGPCLSVSEFGTSGESAVSVALSLLELGLARAILAGAAEAHDGIVDAVLGGARGEGGGFVLLESADAADARGHTPLAVVRSHRAKRGAAERVFVELAAPGARACIVTPRLPAPVAGALARSAWRNVSVQSLFPNVGYHEALGAHALAVAALRLATGEVDEALVVSADLDTAYLTELSRAGATT